MYRYKIVTEMEFVTDAETPDKARLQFLEIMLGLNKLLPFYQALNPKVKNSEELNVEKMEF